MILQIEAAERSLFQGVLRLSPRDKVHFTWDGWIFTTTACASTPINTSDLTPLSLRLAPETKDAFCNRL